MGLHRFIYPQWQYVEHRARGVRYGTPLIEVCSTRQGYIIIYFRIQKLRGINYQIFNVLWGKGSVYIFKIFKTKHFFNIFNQIKNSILKLFVLF
jgi:hypothetical protein